MRGSKSGDNPSRDPGDANVDRLERSRLAHAHADSGRPESQWQSLELHLKNVSELAGSAAARFDAADWGRLAGLWHDLGKYSAEFQRYLREAASPDAHQGEAVGRVDHSTAGAQHAAATFDVVGHLLAFAISGHHSGLLDSIGDGACLEARLGKSIPDWRIAPDTVVRQAEPDLPRHVRAAFAARDGFSVAFFVRMVFSCLVDGDFLDTEEFLAPSRAGLRPRWPAGTLGRLQCSLDRHVSGFGTEGEVNAWRSRVRADCIGAALQEPGLFSLTVPTGGGKTLASMAFALRHAREHGLERVVYVAPFTSIIEQTADVFRRAFADPDDGETDPVVEHHSNLDVGRETVQSRLATENWDAPVIVTTSVQFYESLFANRTSRCRKLHRLARAVVILDEAQSIPVDFLEPCLRALRELANHYGTTVVLCTATQPAVARRPEFPIGLADVREIVSDPPSLYAALKRVDVTDLGEVDDAAITAQLREDARVLCIVNTRRHARLLFEGIREAGDAFHLSASMCPAHRTEVLRRIRDRLDSDRPCRVVSTQLVEAGVDIDFPVVYRSLAGVDSIAQAAGRCNREGRLDRGRTFVFRSEHPLTERFLSDTAGSARQILDLHPDPLALEAVEHYFRLYYWDQSTRWDSRSISGEFELGQERQLPFLFGFASAARRFRLIEDRGEAVIVPWGREGSELCERLRRATGTVDTTVLRGLQRYAVRIPERRWRECVGTSIELVHDRFPVLRDVERHYSVETGLDLDGDVIQDLIV